MAATLKTSLEWLPSLERSFRLPALQALVRCKLSLQHDDWGDVVKFWPADSSGVAQWPWPPAESWSMFREKVATAGIELVLGPLDD